jgi:sugar-specific transcriptional regulator TrmB
MDSHLLMPAGLTQSEADVYLRLLEEGPCLASKVAASAKISRPHVYEALNRLLNKGLVSYVVRENRRYFSAAAPEKFLDVIKEKEEELEKERMAIAQIIPALKKIPKSKEDTDVEVFRGVEGMKTLLADVLTQRGEQRAVGYTGGAYRLARQWWEKWQKARVARKISRRLIADEKMRGHPDFDAPLQQVRFIPSPYRLPVSIMIYGEKTIIFFIPFEDDFVGIRVRSAKLKKSYDSHFAMMWKLAKK